MTRALAFALLLGIVPALSAAETAVANQASPAAEQEDVINQGMLLAGIATALIVVAALGGLAVYVTRKHQAIPRIQDM